MKPEQRLRSTLIAALIWLLGQQFGVCFYNPSTGRWLSRDPIEESAGPNIYASVFNSPLNLADSDGRQAFAVTAEYTFSGRRPSQVPSITPADIANGIQRPLDYLQNAALNVHYANQSTFYNFAVLNNFAVVNGPLDTLRFQFVPDEFLVRNASRDEKTIGCCRETARGLGLALLFAPLKGKPCPEKPPIIPAPKRVNPFELEPTHPITMSRSEFAKLKADIAQNGIKEPIKYVEHNGQKYIVDGHHRARAAKELGLRDVPVEQVPLPFARYNTLADVLQGTGTFRR